MRRGCYQNGAVEMPLTIEFSLCRVRAGIRRARRAAPGHSHRPARPADLGVAARPCGRLRSPYPMPAGCARRWPTSTRELAWGRSCWFLEGGHAGRPWDEGEFGDRNDLASVEAVDAASVLSGNWDLKVPDPDERDGEAAEMIAHSAGTAPTWRAARISAVGRRSCTGARLVQARQG